jgi:4-hydroxy-3-polyprenylbenzoate decarboxylase
VDAAGVHPLLLAIGSERYTPFLEEKRPSELLTIANHILGSGQLSLAKYLFITDEASLDIHDIPAFFKYILERIDLSRDLHFQTNTSIDTLDYSGNGLNTGSKVIFAATGNKKRELKNEIPALNLPDGFENPRVILPGIFAVKGKKYSTAESAEIEMLQLTEALSSQDLSGFPLIVLCDDSAFLSAALNNFLWAAFTRSNPANDIFGVDAFVNHKHWGCKGPLIIDARIKPHHAPPLEKDPAIEKKIERIFSEGGSLAKIKK